ncbi:tetratricopeptide repeat protein [Streptomyces sp. NPDC101206]|uniref:tetratricopeptide repeat protein n=1 Tax=Streptomyces sp. NPDC101206 TaxID=3366128 RepID=UPI00381E9DF0
MTRPPRRSAVIRYGLPLAAGSATLAAAGIRSWLPWAAVVAVALLAGRRRRGVRTAAVGPAAAPAGGPAGPAAVVEARRTPRARSADGPGTVALYELHLPVRPVPVHDLPADTPFAVRLSVHSQIVHLASPDLTGEPETVRIPLTGHNLLLELTSTGPELTLRALTAQTVRTTPFVRDGTASAQDRMPDLAYGADLVESFLRAVASYRPLRPPAYGFRLDAPGPVGPDPVGEGARPLPLAVPAGGSRTLVCAPLTGSPDQVHWRLSAEIECAGRILHPRWDLRITANTGTAAYSPGGGTESLHVRALHPDHWDPDAPPPEPERTRPFMVVGHAPAGAAGLAGTPERARPAPDSPLAARLIAEGDRLRAARRPGAAAGAYRTAAGDGSARAAYMLALVLQDAGRFDEAEGWYRTAADRGANSAYYALGTLALRRNDLEAADGWYRRAMDEGDWNAVVGMGAVLRRRGETALAESVLGLAVPHGIPEARHGLAALLEEQGRAEEAARVRAQEPPAP